MMRHTHESALILIQVNMVVVGAQSYSDPSMADLLCTIFMISNQGSVILFVYTTRASQIILVPDAQQHVCKFVLPPYTCCIINHDRSCFLFLYVIHATIE